METKNWRDRKRTQLGENITVSVRMSRALKDALAIAAARKHSPQSTLIERALRSLPEIKRALQGGS